MTKRDVVFPPGRQALYERNRYSPAVRSNGFLFVSGQVGSREDGSPEPDFETRSAWPSTTSMPCSPRPAARSTTWST